MLDNNNTLRPRYQKNRMKEMIDALKPGLSTASDWLSDRLTHGAD